MSADAATITPVDSESPEVNQSAFPTASRTRRWLWGGGAALVAAVLALYGPVLHYGFVGWDDDRNVTLNPMVTLPEGLARIWASPRGPTGLPNYPLLYTSFWIEYRLWGANPSGYHATNALLHALNAVLVLLLLRQLGASAAAAWVVALLFAVHPMQVESVAWITERKNVLSGAFMLLAFLLYARHRATGGARAYRLALAAFLAALLSKTASVTLAGSLLLADVLVLRPTAGRAVGGIRGARGAFWPSVVRLIPFAILGVLAGLALLSVEDRPAVELPPVARLLVAGRVVWFYVTQLCWPLSMTPIYPRWAVVPTSLVAWLPLLGLAVALAAAWWGRRQVGGLGLWGPAHFLVTLLPVAGLVPFGYQSHSYVADRFVYLACVGVGVLGVLLIERALRRWMPARATGVLLALGVCAALPLGLRTRQQLPVWQDSEHLWSRVVQDNPESWVACGNYGLVLYRQGRAADALAQWQHSLELEPMSLLTHVRVATAMRDLGRGNEAVIYLRRVAGEHPDYPEVQAALGDALAAQGYVREALELLNKTAWAHRSCALALDRLAWVYATSPEAEYRQGAEAVRLAESACHLTSGQDTQVLDTLAAAYAETRQFPKAVEVGERAAAAALREGDLRLAERIRARQALYRANLPYRDRRP